MVVWRRWWHHTWLWCSMPMLMVLIRIAIIIPLLKYLLSTMPQSFLLILFQMSLQCPKHVLLLFLCPSALSSKWFSPVSFTEFSSSSSRSPAGPPPSLRDSAHIGQSSGFWGTDRLMELDSGSMLRSRLLWCGQCVAGQMQGWKHSRSECGLWIVISGSHPLNVPRGETQQ